MILATLCYILDKNTDRVLMLHRIKKDGDIHRGKWNGLGGKFEEGESPEECVVREVYEESGLKIFNPILKGIITFPDFYSENSWMVFLFTTEEFSGELIDSPEGKLEWIKRDKLFELNLWDGDRIFMKWLESDRFFSAKFHYEDGRYISHDVNFY